MFTNVVSEVSIGDSDKRATISLIDIKDGISKPKP